MSIPRQVTITCPYCGKNFSATVFASVNTDYSKDLPRRIIDGTWFDSVCPNCQKTVSFNYDMLYHDMNHHAMIWLVCRKNNPDYQKKVDEIRETPHSGNTTRLVFSKEELREKVACLEKGRDDRVIEICKYFMLDELMRQNPSFEAASVYYALVGDKETMLFYDTSGNALHCFLDEEFYDTMKTQFQDRLDAVPETPYPVIDILWVNELFSPPKKESVSEQSQNDKQESITSGSDKDGGSSADEPDRSLTVRFCRKCGEKIPEDSDFCPYCGTKIIVQSQPSDRNITQSAPVKPQNYTFKVAPANKILNVYAIKAAFSKLVQSASKYPEIRNTEERIHAQWDKQICSVVCEQCGKTCNTRFTTAESPQAAKDFFTETAQRYFAAGYPVELKWICDNCAKKTTKQGPVYADLAFIITIPGTTIKAQSFAPVFFFNTFKYDVTLAFLQGAETISELSERTQTRKPAKEYLDAVRDVLSPLLEEVATQKQQPSDIKSEQKSNSTVNNAVYHNEQAGKITSTGAHNKRKTWVGLLIAGLGIIACIVIAALANRNNPELVKTTSAEESSEEAITTKASSETTPTKTQDSVKLTPITAYNGRVFIQSSYSGTCPLTINADKKSDCYVYLEYVGPSKQSREGRTRIQGRLQEDDIAFYVSAGNSVEIDIPVGIYKFYYATGKNNVFYGTKYLFGEGNKTQYYLSDEKLEFWFDGTYYNGHTITLYLVENGNFDTDPVKESDFPKR